ncbi:class I SAM-dependent DNA methyltransferase [Chryseobacterium rhizosphaerae]|uniref:site-specific DNA-methyltransferase (adenine-specific) n=1 Tax=Chryseobacterium rhizosphaerae TaxID=395937 RepID=A0ABX9IN91_9FLAO|nr:class I SAM-dependent DNA methyltransferase [Chryseobacterium rhizosphaerae]REC75902.1 SAM-dependent DNA methyltransferase [Chryseobacterium rhizosphaerae]GEN67168.1 SAM-dependent DNA methyltransferase [Chryseobacterium rhizosphaerae]
MISSNLVAKIWSFCDTLRDDGVSYGDYLEQITYLLFLKMADEYSRPPYNRNFDIPEKCDWQFFLNHPLEGLTLDYVRALNILADSGRMLSKIFKGAQNKIHDPFKLEKLIKLLNEDEWVSEAVDIKGDIYESLLQKSAESSGAGQYFTPRSIIKAIIECVEPRPLETISDPTCGTGGFFLGAIEYLNKNYSEELQYKNKKEFLQFKTFHGWDIVPSTARLCLMNLFLHGIGDMKETPEIKVEDSLLEQPKKKVKIVLANPPFGNSSTYTITNDEKLTKQESYILRTDFWTTTSNKQLCFVQHIISMLQENGRAAIVLPDNVLFEGGAGEIIRKKLLDETNLHTILRLPTGIFYANGVKVNVLFLEKKKKNSTQNTKEIWFYDYRTNIHHTLKKYPLQFEHLIPFVECYHSKNREKTPETWSEDKMKGRFRKYTYDELLLRDKINFDITWLKDDSFIDLDGLPEPEVLAQEIIDSLESALNSFREVVKSLSKT